LKVSSSQKAELAAFRSDYGEQGEIPLSAYYQAVIHLKVQENF